jgi:iron complex outermembrane receptor protein
MKKLTGIIMLLLSFLNVKSQHTVSGLVTDKLDKSLLLEGVSVYIPEFERIDFTKEGGTYILRNVGIGVVGLQFTKRGYKSVFKQINTFDSATVVNIEMEPFDGPFQEVSEMSLMKKFTENIPYAVHLFSGSQLRRTGNNSLLTALSSQPGFDIFSFGPISKPMIRGLSLNHVAMYQSGAPLLHKSWNEYYSNELIDEGTEIVEWVKGPASLIYGENAMGGVLIFRDEKMPPAGIVNGDINLGFFTNTVGLNVDAGVKGSGKKGTFFSIRVGGKSHASYIQGEGDKVKKNTEEKDFAYHSGFNTGTLKGIFGISKKWGQSRLTVSYLKSQYEIVKSLDEADIAQIEVNEERKRKITEPFDDNSRLTISSESNVLIKKSEIKIKLSGQTNGRSDAEKYTHGNFDVKFISNSSKKFGFTAGTQMSIQNIGYYVGHIAYTSEPDFKKSGGGVYLLLRYDLPKINLMAGGRMDKRKVNDNYANTVTDYNIPSGSVGLAYHPTEAITIKLNESTGFSIPDEISRVSSMYDITIKQDLLKKVTEERNYESDFEFLWNSPSISLGINAYYNLIENYAYLGKSLDYGIILSTGNFAPFTYTRDDAEINGGEFSLVFTPKP